MKKVITLAFVGMAVAGVGHIFVAPTHMQHMTVHGAFLLVVGVAQVGWALAWLRWRLHAMLVSGLAPSGGVLLLWTMLYVVPSPCRPFGVARPHDGLVGRNHQSGRGHRLWCIALVAGATGQEWSAESSGGTTPIFLPA